jgi:hypothetical protein
MLYFVVAVRLFLLYADPCIVYKIPFCCYQLLQLRIQTFVSTAEQMLLSEHVSKPHIEREMRVLQTRWAAFHNQVVESRRLIDLSIEYFKLVEEVSWVHVWGEGC